MLWTSIIFSYVTLIAVTLIDNARGPAWPSILETYQLDQLQGSLVFFIPSLFGAGVNYLSRYWIKWIGPFRALQVALSILVVVSIMVYGSGVIHSWPLLLFSMVLFGVSLGITNIALNVIILKGSTALYYRRALAGLHAMYGIASCGAPLLIGFAGHIGMLWYEVFLWLGTLPLILVFASILIKQRVDGEKESNHSKTKLPLYLQMLMGILFGAYVSAEIAVSSRVVYYATESSKWSVESASLLLSFFFVLLLVGRLLFALLKISGLVHYWLLASMIITFIFSLLAILVHPIFFAFTGLSFSFFFPCAMDWLRGYFSSTLFTQIIGMTSASISISLLLTHLLLGLFASEFGIRGAMLLVPLLIAITFVSYYLLLEKLKKTV